jgi:aminomethyltransferase
MNATLATLDLLPARERRVVRGGTCVAFTLETGDRLDICDPEGLQLAELFVLTPEGEVDPLLLPLGEICLSRRLSEYEADWTNASDFIQFSARNGGKTLPYLVLNGQTEAGATFSMAATCNMVAVLAAPGEDMRPDAQTPATELHVTIERCGGPITDLPSPLAPVKLDIRVKAATAQAYRAKAGDYIQIVDVEGKQCSDFLAFDALALDNGIEKGLDATTTRTLMGSAYPGPGLHSKYFDEDMKPLLEVVRDTVGRHDTFALACTAKYYEDAGYPGHPNCSDNFNAVLTPLGVQPRMGWPAINFFFNTSIDAANHLVLDEPWSRPGDYVLLRALKDLVCASSSCADDIDPANAWNPTDIHVRLYDSSANISKGSALRITPDAEPRLTRDTAFHPRLAALTRSFTDYRGFWLPNHFQGEGPISEYWACRTAAVVMDLSALRKFEITGPDAEQLLQRAQTRDMAKLGTGQVVYSAFCYETGGMIDDGTIMRLARDNFRLIAGDEFTGLWLRQKALEWGLKVWVKSSTDQLANLALQGPVSRTILTEVIKTPPHQATIDELKWFRFTIGRIGATGPSVLVSRTGYTGELGYEIWCHPKDAVAVWDALWEAGAPRGMTPLGLEALDMLRIEAGLVFAGFEFCDQTDPFEAGIGFVVAAKESNFIGKAALERRKAHPARRLVGLDLEGNETIGHGDPVFWGRTQIGLITSATRSPILKKTVALARLDVAMAELGTRVEIGKLDGHQKRLEATIVPFPHYDPQKSRVRA